MGLFGFDCLFIYGLESFDILFSDSSIFVEDDPDARSVGPGGAGECEPSFLRG